MFRKIALVSRVYIESLLFVSVLLTSSFVFIVYVNTEPQNISLPGLILGRILVFYARSIYVLRIQEKRIHLLSQPWVITITVIDLS